MLNFVLINPSRNPLLFAVYSLIWVVEKKEAHMQTTHIPSKTQLMPTAFSLDKNLHARLAALAESSSQQPEQLIEKAVREYVERQEYHNTRALEDVEAWKQFEASGRKEGISLDKAVPWLDSWGTANELPPPVSMVKAK